MQKIYSVFIKIYFENTNQDKLSKYLKNKPKI